jgi:predicted nucleic acid-binding protein
MTGGHRSLDVLHVATALHLGAREFLTFDANQRKLALAENLKVKP